MEGLIADLLAQLRGKHMGLLLLASVLTYGIQLRRQAVPVMRVAISCVAVFLAARLAALVLRQAALLAAGGWQNVGPWGRTLLVFLMPAVLYVAVPWLAYHYRWFGGMRRDDAEH